MVALEELVFLWPQDHFMLIEKGLDFISLLTLIDDLRDRAGRPFFGHDADVIAVDVLQDTPCHLSGCNRSGL